MKLTILDLRLALRWASRLTGDLSVVYGSRQRRVRIADTRRAFAIRPRRSSP